MEMGCVRGKWKGELEVKGGKKKKEENLESD
jgi:hypothetical protein